MEYHAFLSFANEDKKLAERLYEALINEKLNVWFSGEQLLIGDSLFSSINKSIGESRYGIVLISPDYLKKTWPLAELASFFARYTATNKKVIIPIWHNISAIEILHKAPLIADLFAGDSSMDLKELAIQIKKSMLK